MMDDIYRGWPHVLSTIDLLAITFFIYARFVLFYFPAKIFYFKFQTQPYISVQQNKCHKKLASTPKHKDVYTLPQGYWFELVACPHYFFEIVIYCSLWMLSGRRLMSCNTMILMFVTMNLVRTSIETKRKYGDTRVKAIIPYIL